MYLADKDLRIFAYSLSLNVVEYQTAVLRGDMDAAAEILPTLPKEQLNKVARFLEGRGAYLIPFILLITDCPFYRLKGARALGDDGPRPQVRSGVDARRP